MANTVKEAVEISGLAPHRLEVEITESTILHDLPSTRQTLRAIRAMGVRISLDDFGTGYSSLSYLRRFPIDKIKIDQSFVSQLGKEPESSAIIKAIVEMADALALRVIAEGVETGDQVHRLIQAGCSHFQGYLYSRPVDAAVIGSLLAERTKLAA